MAVYTPLSRRDIENLLDDYALGALDSFEGIVEGVENSNFHLFTTRGRVVLTVFERRVREVDLPFFMSYVDHLRRNGRQVPGPIRRRDGEFLSRAHGKPCVVSEFLTGTAIAAPTAPHCRSAGAALAQLHVAGAGFERRRENDLSLEGWRRIASACGAEADRCAPGLAALIADELGFLQSRWPRDLPQGAAHLDFFPDNVFFNGEAVSGVIDFYFSATDSLAYDLAIGALAWSSDRGRLDDRRLTSFIDGYDSVRPLSLDERRATPVLLRGAATRFLLTRLYDWLNRVEGALVAIKDPLEYRDLLLALRERV